MTGLAPAPAATGSPREPQSCRRVDVWEAALEPCGSEAAWRTLSDSERGHAARLRVGAAHWVAARVALRRILGRYLGLSPARVPLERGPNGKPRLIAGWGPDLRFNLSHSAGLALIAARLGHDVGIDLEALRPGVDGDAILRAVFAAPERAAPAAIAAEGPGDDFFRAWVRREALAKATGRGIIRPPLPDEAVRYTVRDLEGIPGFAAALASEGADWSVRRAGPA